MHLFIALYAVWIVLSGRGDPFFIIAGVVSCAIALAIAQRMGAWEKHQGPPIYFHLRMWSFMIWLMKEIVVSGLQVARLVLKPDLEVSPILASIRTSQKTELGMAIYANAITLTPGTVSVGVQKNRIIVHALDRKIYSSLVEEAMDRKITQELER